MHKAIVAVLLSVSASPAAAESLVLGKAGLALPEIKAPAPEAPKGNQWLTLRKIQVNSAAPEMNDTLVGVLDRTFDAYTAVRELTQAGFKVQAYQSNTGGYLVFVDVTGADAADLAVGLARYYYVTEVRVGGKVYEQIFGAQRSKSAYAVTQGTIKGFANHSPADLKLDKRGWVFSGAINHAPVDVRIDHEAKTISGAANHSPVSLRFDWSQEQVRVYGASNHAPADYTVNWKAGLLEGAANRAPVRLEFDLGQGDADQKTVAIRGYAGRAPVDLSYDKVSGRLAGHMNRAPVDVALVNCDIYDFLQYFFLFLKDANVQ